MPFIVGLAIITEQVKEISFQKEKQNRAIRSNHLNLNQAFFVTFFGE